MAEVAAKKVEVGQERLGVIDCAQDAWMCSAGNAGQVGGYFV